MSQKDKEKLLQALKTGKIEKKKKKKSKKLKKESKKEEEKEKKRYIYVYKSSFLIVYKIILESINVFYIMREL